MLATTLDPARRLARRTCLACSHRLRFKIDTAILSGTALETISEVFGIGVSTLSRHRSECCSPTEFVQSEAGVELVFSLKQDLTEMHAFMAWSVHDANEYVMSLPPGSEKRFDKQMKFNEACGRTIDRLLATAGMKMLAEAMSVETDKGVIKVEFNITPYEDKGDAIDSGE